MKEEFQKKIENKSIGIIDILKNESKEYLIDNIKNKSLSSIFNIVFKEIQISIIIPTYNRKENVCNLVNSLLLQINKNFEIIIVDDGSTDNTYDALRVFSNHKNISSYRIENSERGAARNYGASMARGKYLNFFDSDDIALENHTKVASSKILELNNPPLFNLSYAYKFENKIKNIVLSGKINNKLYG